MSKLQWPSLKRMLDSLRSSAAEPSVAPPGSVPPAFHGYVDEISAHHVAGWVWNRHDPAERVAFEAVLPATREIVGRGVADHFNGGLRDLGMGDGKHVYFARLSRPISPEEGDNLEVRPVGSDTALSRPPHLSRTYLPVQYIVMDLVDNCNLRCPFCVYDYNGVHTTNVMDEATIDAVVRFAPLVADGNFWFSCLHEPTLHPRLIDYIYKVAPEARNKLFFTSNLAKRMPDSYFTALANSGMHHVNISIESLDPAIYERMRKGARHRFFLENWNKLVPAFAAARNPPMLRYITLAYKSNFRELPSMIEYLLNERGGGQIEVRHTYDVPHLPQAFREAEFLDRDEWLWLRDALAHFPADKLLLDLPAFVHQAPPGTPSAEPTPVAQPRDPVVTERQLIPGRYAFNCALDGALDVSRVVSGAEGPPSADLLLTRVNVRDIADPLAFIRSLPV